MADCRTDPLASDVRETRPFRDSPIPPKIPTAAEIIAQREALKKAAEALKQAEALVESHAIDIINEQIDALAAVGKYYVLTEGMLGAADAPAASPPKPRAAMKCGNCGQPGHRSNKCKTTVEVGA